jgi:acyl-CoA synthetase (AMP-forming)/AMP-acid ligase II
MGFNIADMFEYAADAVPDRLALVEGDRRLTYRELDEQTNRFAGYLRSVGIGHGDHIGIYGYNSIEWVVAMVGALRPGRFRSTSTTATSRTSCATSSTTPT